MKFFDPAIFQKCWRGPGRGALVAARRRRNTPAHALAPRRIEVRKATAFRGESEQDRFPLFPTFNKRNFENVPVGRFQQDRIIIDYSKMYMKKR